MTNLQWNSLQGSDSIWRWHLTSIGNPIVEIRRSYDRLISTMRFPILVRVFILNQGPGHPVLCHISPICSMAGNNSCKRAIVGWLGAWLITTVSVRYCSLSFSWGSDNTVMECVMWGNGVNCGIWCEYKWKLVFILVWSLVYSHHKGPVILSFDVVVFC